MSHQSLPGRRGFVELAVGILLAWPSARFIQWGTSTLDFAFLGFIGFFMLCGAFVAFITGCAFIGGGAAKLARYPTPALVRIVGSCAGVGIAVWCWH